MVVDWFLDAQNGSGGPVLGQADNCYADVVSDAETGFFLKVTIVF